MDDDDVARYFYGESYDVSIEENPVVERSFEMRRGVLVPKQYQQKKRPIGFVWEE